jgi:hypothetical protein
VAFLRPKTSFIQPPVAAPIIAPTNAMLTIVSCKHKDVKRSGFQRRQYENMYAK